MSPFPRAMDELSRAIWNLVVRHRFDEQVAEAVASDIDAARPRLDPGDATRLLGLMAKAVGAFPPDSHLEVLRRAAPLFRAIGRIPGFRVDAPITPSGRTVLTACFEALHPNLHLARHLAPAVGIPRTKPPLRVPAATVREIVADLRTEGTDELIGAIAAGCELDDAALALVRGRITLRLRAWIRMGGCSEGEARILAAWIRPMRLPERHAREAVWALARDLAHAAPPPPAAGAADEAAVCDRFFALVGALRDAAARGGSSALNLAGFLGGTAADGTTLLDAHLAGPRPNARIAAELAGITALSGAVALPAPHGPLARVLEWAEEAAADIRSLLAAHGHSDWDASPEASTVL